MPHRKPLVVVTRRLPESVETRMRELFNAALNIDDHAMSKDELIEAVKKAHVLVPTVTDEIDADVIAAGPRLRAIASSARWGCGDSASSAIHERTSPSWKAGPSPIRQSTSSRRRLE
mgnify:CR=1 FL=1